MHTCTYMGTDTYTHKITCTWGVYLHLMCATVMKINYYVTGSLQLFHRLVCWAALHLYTAVWRNSFIVHTLLIRRWRTALLVVAPPNTAEDDNNCCSRHKQRQRQKSCNDSCYDTNGNCSTGIWCVIWNGVLMECKHYYDCMHVCNCYINYKNGACRNDINSREVT